MNAQLQTIKFFYNSSSWEEDLINVTAHLNSSVNKKLARELLDENLTKCAALLIDKCINSGERWAKVKQAIFGELKLENDISCYNKYLSHQWNILTSNLIQNAFEVDKKLNTRESQSFLKKLRTKLDIEDYLKRDLNSIAKIQSLTNLFFSRLDDDFSTKKLKMEISLNSLLTFYKRISETDIQALSKFRMKKIAQSMANDKQIHRQQEFLRSAINSEIRSVSMQSLVEIFGNEEAPQQATKLTILGIFVFDANDIKARKNVAEDYAAEQMKKLLIEDPFHY